MSERLPIAQKFIIDVFDSSANRIGKGPIRSAMNVTVTRRLDEAGSWAFTFPAADTDALAIVANNNRVEIRFDTPPPVFDSRKAKGIRVLARGVIERVNSSAGGAQPNIEVSGRSDLAELSYKSVLLGRIFNNQNLSDIIDSLIALVPGWSATSDVGLGVYSGRFDGPSVLKAFITLAEQTGNHIRADLVSRILEFGAFGDDSGWVLYGPATRTREMRKVSNRIVVDQVAVIEENSDTVNWILPLGAGEGDSKLTLEQSTRTTPYTIQSVGLPDGRIGHFLSVVPADRERIVTFSNIAPISNSATSTETASNALYDAAAAWLDRNSVALTTYRVSGIKPDVTLQVGDKIRLNYKYIPKLGGQAVINVNQLLWILSVTENISSASSTISLEVSTIDRRDRTDARTIVNTIESLQARNILVQPFFNAKGFGPFAGEIDGNHTVTVPVFISNATLRVERVLLRIDTRPFRSTEIGAASGGGSVQTTSNGGGTTVTSTSGGAATVTSQATELERIKLFDDNPNQAAGLDRTYTVALNSSASQTTVIKLTTAGNFPGNIWSTGAIGSHSHGVTIPNHSHGVTIPNHSHDVTIPNHSHDQIYGIVDDTETPDTVRIAINGADKTAELGGPWAVGGGALSGLELDVTDIINAAATLQQTHNVVFSCDSGQGTVQTVVEIYEIIQQLKV